MEVYHIYFFTLKIIILILLLLIFLRIIKLKSKIFILIDFIFKFSMGLLIIIFFSTNKSLNISKEDRLLFIVSGFILIILIDYIKVINILFNKNYMDIKCDYNIDS